MSDEDQRGHARADEIEKFAFGQNWSRFLSSINDDAIHGAEEGLRHLLDVERLEQLTFLDAGSGSGLMSLAAYNLGADVSSFDYDPDSVACTRHLQSQVDHPDRWSVAEGSLLNQEFLGALAGDDPAPAWDVVYCWGVAHHTGDMWRALENLTGLVAKDGRLVVAIYNDEQYISRLWYGIKRIYQRLPALIRPVYVLAIWMVLFLRRCLFTAIACGLRLFTLRNPAAPIIHWVRETRQRGMNSWHDLVDWVGGWPFEVARPEEIFRFMRDRGFTLTELTTSGGHGCNEFVFRKNG